MQKNVKKCKKMFSKYQENESRNFWEIKEFEVVYVWHVQYVHRVVVYKYSYQGPP